jgi:hypothetical protein
MRIGTSIPQFQNAIQSADVLANEALSQNVNQAEPASLDQIQDSFSNSGINESEFVQMLQSGHLDLNPDSRLEGLMKNAGHYKNPVYRNYVEAGLFDPLTMPEKLLQKVANSLKELMTPANPISPVDSTSMPSPGEIMTPNPPAILPQSGLSNEDQRAIIIIGGSPDSGSQYQALQEMQSAVQQNVDLSQQINSSMFKGIIFR